MRPPRSVLFALALALAMPLAAAADPVGPRGLSRADMDTTVSPCEDFYRYANGGWIGRAQMPPTESRYGGFEELRNRVREDVRRLLDDVMRQAKAPAGSNAGRLAVFCGTCMDSALAEREGARPLRPYLRRIAALKSRSALAAEIASLHMDGFGVLFGFGGSADPGNSTMVIATINQGGLGLPDRDYYFKTDAASENIRGQYLDHVTRTLQLLGDGPDEAARQARAAMALETELARGSLTRVQQRDPKAVYHKMPLADVVTLCPSFDWRAYLAGSGLARVAEANVRQPGFLAGMDSLLRAAPLADWQAYLRWRVADIASPALSSAFVSEGFRFQQVLTGAKENLPRWRRCLEATDRALGEPLGQEYVKVHFTPETKARVLAMVGDLKEAFRERIRALPWMSEATKAQALRKLEAMGLKIGYPDTWRDYSGLRLERGPFIENQIRAARFERAWRLGKIGKPVDRSEFSMTPVTVNARYSPSLNDILFPAGILQPPFFDPQADNAVNYGGIGAVIGHEMTHGFDDSGRQYDAEGNLKDWWTAEDAQKYREQADKIVAQYDAYTVLDTVHLNGRLTTGENISDLGGLTMGMVALRKALAGKPHPVIDGFTPEQRFFLANARIWRQIVRPEESRRLVATDPHSPGIWRVMGPLSNMPEFERAFGCSGSPMMRPEADRVRIW